MNDHFLKSTLFTSDFDNPLFNSIGGDKSINHDRFGLTNTMTSILSLQVLLWILD